MNRPVLSVLIDTYNHEKYIEQCVLSAIEQDFPASDYEILVVDDGSTDRTADIVRKFAPRVRLLRKKNGGQASAFNAAFPELRGETVAFLDGDDWFAPGKLTAVMNALEEHPEVAAVGHGYYEFHDKTGEAIPRAPDGRAFLSLATPEAAVRSLPDWRFLLLGALTARKSVLRQVMPLPHALRFCADGPIAWACLANGCVVFQDALCYYRWHENNLHAGDSGDAATMRRKSEMDDRMFRHIEGLLLRLRVPMESMLASFYPMWLEINRSSLRAFGGSRTRTFRTEMRYFRNQYGDPTMVYRLFKYLIVGPAALLLPPRLFYRARDWYGRRNLGRLRHRFAGTGRVSTDAHR